MAEDYPVRSRLPKLAGAMDYPSVSARQSLLDYSLQAYEYKNDCRRICEASWRFF